MPSIGKHNDTFLRSGVGGLLTPEQFEMAWTQYQQGLVNRLNHILAGDAREFWDVKTILLDTARNPATANTFNYASMAHNNHFFFKCLSPHPVGMSAALTKELEASFSSIDTLRSTMLATAAAMFGPGFVWLVQDNPQRGHAFKILTTYLAGTPYPGAHHRQQNRDLNTSNLENEEDYLRQNRVQNSAGAFGSAAANRGMGSIDGGGRLDEQRFGGADCVPVLCVNTWEHAYLMDWGLEGKMQYLETWWDHIDWEVVQSHCLEVQGRQFPR